MEQPSSSFNYQERHIVQLQCKLSSLFRSSWLPSCCSWLPSHSRARSSPAPASCYFTFSSAATRWSFRDFSHPVKTLCLAYLDLRSSFVISWFSPAIDKCVHDCRRGFSQLHYRSSPSIQSYNSYCIIKADLEVLRLPSDSLLWQFQLHISPPSSSSSIRKCIHVYSRRLFIPSRDFEGSIEKKRVCIFNEENEASWEIPPPLCVL